MQFELSEKIGDMTLRQHLETAWKQSGVMPAQLAQVLPEECRSVWNAFTDLRASCPSNGFGPGRISYSEIDAYQRTTGDILAPWEITAIRRADRVWIGVQDGN